MPAGLTPNEILDAVCQVLNVTHLDVAGIRREPRLVLARALVSTLTAKLSIASTPEVAKAMGKPSHSPVVEARAMLNSDPDYVGKRVDACVARLYDRHVSYQSASGEQRSATVRIEQRKE